MDNLDPQDREICNAILGGKADEEIATEFGVEVEKVASLRGVVEKGEAPADAPEQPEVADQPASDTANKDAGTGEEAPAEPTAEETPADEPVA